MRHFPNVGHKYAGLFAELNANPLSRFIAKFKRAWEGGVWVLHDDLGWVRADWTGEPGFLYDSRGHGYHRTLISILTIEDYT